jgi:hypothetical protein
MRRRWKRSRPRCGGFGTDCGGSGSTVTPGEDGWRAISAAAFGYGHVSECGAGRVQAANGGVRHRYVGHRPQRIGVLRAGGIKVAVPHLLLQRDGLPIEPEGLVGTAERGL